MDQEKTGKNETNQIIREHVNYSMALAALPIPLVDLAGVTMVQLNMVRKLTRVFGVNFAKEEKARTDSEDTMNKLKK